MNFKKHRRVISLIILTVVTLSVFSYDYSYFMFNHKVKHQESLWSILTYDVYGNANIADHSIKFLKNQNPEFDYNYIQANTSQFSNDGDTVNIWGAKIYITTPGDELRLEPTYLLPRYAVWNHNIQITYQNILLLFIAGIAFYAIIKKIKIKRKKMLENIPQLLFFSFITGSLLRMVVSLSFLFSRHSEATLQSSVFVFKNTLLMTLVLTFLTIYFTHKNYKRIGLGFGISLGLYLVTIMYLLNTPSL